MATNGFAGKQFQTAAARRGGKPLVFQVEYWAVTDDEMAAWLAQFETSEPPDGEPGHLATATLLIDPLLDLVRLGSTFGGFGTALVAFGADGTSDEEKMRVLDVEMPRIKDALRECLVPPSRLKWDECADQLDVIRVGELIRWLTQELSGLDPTPLRSSSTGSPATGSTSTDGAPLEASIPATSPSGGR